MDAVRWLYRDPIYKHVFWSATPPTSPRAVSDPLLIALADGTVVAP